MPTINTLFKSAGICTHANGDTIVTKVRFGTDFVSQVKMLSNPKKIEVRGVGCLAPVRVDLIELPEPMLKMDALKFIQAHPKFQSPEDQALIADKIAEREPKAPKVPKAKKEPKVRATKKSAPSLDSIKTRGRKTKITAEEVLAVVAQPVSETDPV